VIEDEDGFEGDRAEVYREIVLGLVVNTYGEIDCSRGEEFRNGCTCVEDVPHKVARPCGCQLAEECQVGRVVKFRLFGGFVAEFRIESQFVDIFLIGDLPLTYERVEQSCAYFLHGKIEGYDIVPGHFVHAVFGEIAGGSAEAYSVVAGSGAWVDEQEASDVQADASAPGPAFGGFFVCGSLHRLDSVSVVHLCEKSNWQQSQEEEG